MVMSTVIAVLVGGLLLHCFLFSSPFVKQSRAEDTSRLLRPSSHLGYKPELSVLGSYGKDPISYDILRRFRDEVLGKSPQGQEYVLLFSRHSPEAALLLLRNPDLRTRADGILRKITPWIHRLLRGEEISMPQEMVSDTQSFLSYLAMYASADMRSSILRVREELGGRDFLLSMRNSSSHFHSLDSHVSNGPKTYRPAAGSKYSSEYVLVKFKFGLLQSREDEIHQSVSLRIGEVKVLKQYKDIGVYKVKIPKNKVLDAINEYMAHVEVEYAEPDYVVRIIRAPNDPAYGCKLWGLDNTGQSRGIKDADIDAPEAWDITTGGKVVVAVIDSGVNYDHEDLSSNIWVNAAEVPNNGTDDEGVPSLVDN
jgi:hypothetical protein